MIVNWNPLVNTKFSLEGDFSLQDGYIEELQFDNGKKRTWLRNSYVPRVLPSLNLLLDNKTELENGKTEFEEFEEWFNRSLRYGSFTFQTARLGFRKKWHIKIPEMGIYKFLGVPEYDRLDGLILATFGLEEEAVIPAIQHVFLATNDRALIRTNTGNFISA